MRIRPQIVVDMKKASEQEALITQTDSNTKDSLLKEFSNEDPLVGNMLYQNVSNENSYIEDTVDLEALKGFIHQKRKGELSFRKRRNFYSSLISVLAVFTAFLLYYVLDKVLNYFL